MKREKKPKPSWDDIHSYMNMAELMLASICFFRLLDTLTGDTTLIPPLYFFLGFVPLALDIWISLLVLRIKDRIAARKKS